MSQLILLLPLVSAITCGLLNKRISSSRASWIACSLMSVTAIIGIETFAFYSPEHIILAEWFSVGELHVNWSIYIDELTAIMLMVVTIVSAVVHLYSIGYMHDDENLPRFMSYLSLFTFFMLVLVCSDNFIQLFVGWEGVGLCSYLLIGFWYKKLSANSAAIKAFLVNRVSDFAFILGLISIIYYCQAVDFSSVFAKAEYLSDTKMAYGCSALDAICLLLFIGCMGKSAQIGLHVWLPDAMEGPTPVSALIHAATMVTAGVFLVARCSFMFELSPMVMDFMAFVGAVTCLFAATIAIMQNDIKKIIAYSTCSQLGYMFMACGVGAYRAGIFHLATHAFFKAMLFLGAGSVIHAVHEQDITKMGGLRKSLPYTYIMFWLGSLAIIGIFPFAGYYSKDMILEASYLGDSTLFYFGIVAAFFTACYSMKIIVMVFHGSSENSQGYQIKSEGGLREDYAMILPLSVLVIGTICAGFVGVHYLSIGEVSGYFGASIVASSASHREVSHFIEYLPLIVGVIGMVAGVLLFSSLKRGSHGVGEINTIRSSPRDILSCFKKIVTNKYYFDELYEIMFVRTVAGLSLISRIFDIAVIDACLPSGAAYIVRKLNKVTQKMQSGYIFNYALFMLLGVVVAMTWSLMRFI